jgi:purine-nucleoside phosphorylase
MLKVLINKKMMMPPIAIRSKFMKRQFTLKKIQMTNKHVKNILLFQWSKKCKLNHEISFFFLVIQTNNI